MTTGEGESGLGPTRRAARQRAERAQEIFGRFAPTQDGELLKESISEMRAAVNLAHSAGIAEAAVYQVLLHVLCLTRWRLVRDPGDLEEILQGRTDGDAAIESHPVHRPMHMSNMAEALEERFALLGRPEDVEEAIVRWERAVRLTPEDDPLLDFRRQGLERARRSRAVMADPRMREVLESEWLHGTSDSLELRLLATGHQLRFAQGGPLSESDAAISLLTRAIGAARDVGTKLMLQEQLGTAWDDRFRRTGLAAHLDRAIALYDEVLTATADDEKVSDRIANLVNAHYLRVETVGDARHMEAAVVVLRRLAERFDDRETQGQAWTGLCSMRGRIALLTRRREDTEEAVAAGREAVDRTRGTPHHAAALSALAAGLASAFDILGDERFLEEAASSARGAVDATGRSVPERGVRLLNAGNAFCRLGELREDTACLDRGLHFLAEAAGTECEQQPQAMVATQHWRVVRHGLSGDPGDMDAVIETGLAHRGLGVRALRTRVESLRFLCGALLDRGVRRRSLADLDSTALYAAELLALLPQGDPSRSRDMYYLRGRLAERRYELSGDPGDLDSSIAASEEVLAAGGTDLEGTAEIHRSLRRCLQRRFKATGNPADLHGAVLHGQQLCALLPPDHPATVEALFQLAGDAVQLSEVLPTAARAEAAVGFTRAALAAAAESSETAVRTRLLLCRVLTQIATTQADPTMLDESVEVGDAAVAAASGHPELKAYALSALGNALLGRYRARSDVADLNRALEASEALADMTPSDAPDRAQVLFTLADLLDETHRHHGRAGDVERAIELLGEAADLSEADRPTAHLKTARLLRRRFRVQRRPADIDRAIELLEEAVGLLDDPIERHACLAELTGCLSDRKDASGPGPTQQAASRPGTERSDGHASMTLATALFSQFKTHAHRELLDAAVRELRAALHALPSDDPVRPFAHSNLCHFLLQRFSLTGLNADLDEAVSAGSAALSALAEDVSDAHMIPMNASTAFATRYLEAGRIEDLDEALRLCRIALRLSPEGRPRTQALAHLSARLVQRHDELGSLDDLDEAVRCLEQAVSWRLPDGSRDPAALSQYSIALRTRHEVLDTLEDLDRSIVVAREAAGSTHLPPDLAPAVSNNLGLALWRRAERFTSVADATEAVDLFRRAASREQPDHHRIAGALGNLASALQFRHELTGATSDLEEAAEAAQAALDAVSEGHAENSIFLTRLSLIHLRLYVQTAEPRHLQKAVAFGRRAVAVAPSTQPHKATALFDLGQVLLARSRRSGSSSDLRMAQSLLARAAHHPAGSPLTRVMAARKLGEAAARAGAWQRATAAYDLAIALKAASGHREPAGDAVYQFTRFHDLASDAAACHLRLGDVQGAVEAWEEGRTELLTAELRARHPDLDRLERADGRSARQLFRLLGADGPASGASRTDRETDRYAEISRIVAEIRQRPSFEDFLRPPSLTDLRELAQDGPMIAVTLSELGSHAIVITDTDDAVVDLPGITPQQVFRRAAELAEAVTGEQPDEELLRGILIWLGDQLVAPVLRELRSRCLRISPDVRLRWSLSSWLAMLPVQAALVVPEGGAERVPAFTLFTPVFSFSLRGFQHARLRAQRNAQVAAAPKDILAVAVPSAEGLSPLLGALLELSVLHALFGPRVRALSGRDATRAAVTEHLPASTIAHFSCHGISDPSHPTRSALLLSDHARAPLTVRDVLTLDLPRAQLAYLSACSTAAPGTVAEQAIHPASAFQVAGYPTVIGTLWAVSDGGAAAVARDVYTAIASHGTSAAPTALATACADAYGTDPGRPSRWAAFICYGT